MVYIHNGRVVEKKPFSLRSFVLALWSALALFFSTFFTLQPMSQAVEAHQHPTPATNNVGLWERLRGLLTRGRGQTLGSSSSGTNGGSWAAAVNRRGGNVHTLPKPPTSGGCAGGGCRR
jgi:hypothetical protein